jgi:hypothetical protein
MSNLKQKLAMKNARKHEKEENSRQANADRERRHLEREFEGNEAIDLRIQMLFAKHTKKSHDKSNQPLERKHVPFSLSEVIAGVFGVGVGAFFNHISGTRFIYFFVWFCVTVYFGFHFWPNGKWWRRSVVTCSILLLLVVAQFFANESPTRTALMLNLRIGSRHSKPIFLKDEYLMRELSDPVNFMQRIADISGFVVVPMPSTSNDVPLVFGIGLSEKEIEGISIKVFIPTNCAYQCDTNYWTDQDSVGPEFSAIACMDKSVSPIKAIATKPITLNIANLNPGDHIPLLAVVASTHSKRFWYAFNVMFAGLPGVTNFSNCPLPQVFEGFRHGNKFVLAVHVSLNANGEWSFTPYDPYPQPKIIYHSPP